MFSSRVYFVIILDGVCIFDVEVGSLNSFVGIVQKIH
jgi:hypothetical protein